MPSGDEATEPETLFRFAPFAGFARIARRHLSQMQELVNSLPPEPPPSHGDEDPPDDDAHLIWFHETQKTRELIDEHAAVTVIFACAAVELYINDAAGRLLGDNYFEKHIDRVDLLSKWVLVPRLACGHQIDRNAQAYNLLRLTISLRNDLMHPKAKALTTEQYEKSTMKRMQEAAANAVKMLAALLQETRKFDRQGLGEVHL